MMSFSPPPPPPPPRPPPVQIASRLPSEPPSSVPHARIRFRSVERGQFERRFLPGDPLAVLFDFLASEGFPQEEHKVLSSWPRRDVSGSRRC